MSVQLVLILILLVVFLIATVLPVHMGALALVAAFVAGYLIDGLTTRICPTTTPCSAASPATCSSSWSA